MSAPAAAPSPAPIPVELDPLSLAKNSSGIVFFVLLLLVCAAVAVWFVTVLKLLQLRRWAKAQERFEREAAAADGAEVLFELARRHGDAPGARVIRELERRRGVPLALEGVCKRAIVDEQKRASTLMPVLASIGSAAPFVGLFGTVWGIMDAFLKIGREKSASLPVVAPSIGEALIATAVGLFAAIPAVVAYNAIVKRVDDLLSAVEAAAHGWLALIAPAAFLGSSRASASEANSTAPMGSSQAHVASGHAPAGASFPAPAPPAPAQAPAAYGQQHAASWPASQPVPLQQPVQGGRRPPPFPGAR